MGQNIIYATPKQLTGYYGISLNLVYKMLDEMRREGNKGVLKIGRAVRINVDAFQEFLERKTEEANELQGKISN